MIEDHVHDDLQSFPVTGIDKCLVFFVRTEARVDTVVVGGGISVIGTVFPAVSRTVILQYRREPKGCHTEVGEVIEVLADAFQIAAVPQTRFVAVAELILHPLDDVVLRIAVGEAVGHEHVQNIRVVKPFPVGTGHGTGFELDLLSGGLIVFVCEAEGYFSWLRIFQVEVNEEIVRRVEADDRIYPCIRIVGGHIRELDVLAVDHQLECRILHPGEPAGRLDARYDRRGWTLTGGYWH